MADIVVDSSALATTAVVPKRARKKRSIGLWLAGGWMFLVFFAAAFGPWLPIPDPGAQGKCTTHQPRPKLDAAGHKIVVNGAYVVVEDPGCPAQTAADDSAAAVPSARHLLGNDQIGRDLLARVVAGARTTVVIAFGAVLAAVVIGGIIGAVIAYIGRWLDAVVTSLLAGLLAMPAIVMAIALVAAFGRSVFTVWLSLTIVATPAVAILSRGQALSLVRREYVTASKMIGAKHRRVLWREVMPNLLPFAFVFVGIGVAAAIAAEGGLAVLGLGVPEPSTSWGALISDGRPLLATFPHISLVPSTVMFLTIWATTFLTDQARTHFDVRESQL